MMNERRFVQRSLLVYKCTDNDVLYQLEKYFFEFVHKEGLPFRLDGIDVGEYVLKQDSKKLRSLV